MQLEKSKNLNGKNIIINKKEKCKMMNKSRRLLSICYFSKMKKQLVKRIIIEIIYSLLSIMILLE
jgi:hypothetical protein